MPAASISLIDQTLPRYDANEVHQRRLPVAPEVAWTALKTTPMNEVRLASRLMAIRNIPKYLTGQKPIQAASGLPPFDALQRAGFVVLGEIPEEEIVVGVIGKFWKLAGNSPVKVADRMAFMQFTQPGYARAVMNFRLVPEVGGTRIVTETRILGTDPASSRAFKRYWFVIRLPSGAIRRSWLAAIARRCKS